MLRLLGAAFVFGGVFWLGWAAGQELHVKTDNLQELVGALEQLKQEMTFRLMPLPELLDLLGERPKGNIGTFFKNCSRHAQNTNGMFLKGWKEEAERLSGQLDDRAVKSLIRLGYGIGRYDWEEEERLLSNTIAELERYLREIKAESGQRSRLYRTLGAAAGAILVIWFY